MFTIDFDEASNLVRVAGTGTWNPIAIAQFALEARRLHAHHLAGRRNVRILGDARGMTIQSVAATQLYRAIAVRLLAKPDLRIAVIVGSMLSKMQAERTYQGLAVGVFLSEPDALAYLDTARPGAQAAA